MSSKDKAQGGSDRFNFQNQLEHLHSKYAGTGDSNTSKWDWACNIQRDTMASHIGHHSRLLYFSAAENEPTARLRHRFLVNMIQPCGPPPAEYKIDEIMPQ